MLETDRWEEDYTRGITKSKPFVDTKVCVHGSKKLKYTNSGLQAPKGCILKWCRMCRHLVQNNVHNAFFLVTAGAQHGLAVWREGIDHAPSTIRMPRFLDMVSEIFVRVRVLEFCKLRCSTSGSSLDEAHFALEPRTWKAWTVIFSMANSNTKFLPLASAGRLAWHCLKNRSLLPVLQGPCFLCSVMMLFSFFHCHFEYIATLFLRFTPCALNGPPLGIQDLSQG